MSSLGGENVTIHCLVGLIPVLPTASAVKCTHLNKKTSHEIELADKPTYQRYCLTQGSLSLPRASRKDF